MHAKAFVLTAGLMLMGHGVAAQTADSADWKPASAGTTFIFANSSSGTDDTFKILALDGITIKRDVNGTVGEEVGLLLNISSRETMDESARGKAAALWPLKVGNRVSFSHGGTNSKGSVWTSSDEAEVIATEDVTVPAGTFRTFVIKTSMSDLPYFEGKRTCWYAPDLGYCAKSRWQRSGRTTEDTTWELKAVTKAQ